MAVRKSDVERQIAALQAQLADADSDDEVWIKDGDHEIKVTGNRATTVLQRFAKLWESDDEGGGEDDEPEKQDPPAAAKKPSYFRGK